MKDAISYIQVSSEEQADSGLGLEAQRQSIAAFCAMKGLHLAEVFEDPAIPRQGSNCFRRTNSFPLNGRLAETRFCAITA